MRKIVLGILVLSFFCLMTSAVFSAQKKKAAEPAPAVVLTPAQVDALTNTAIAELNKAAWTIYLLPQGAKKPKEETDVLTFSGTGMVSQNLSAKGFSGSQYSLTVNPDNTALFQTVQRNEKGDLALWSGTITGLGTASSSIYGTLTIMYKDGSRISYSFKSGSGWAVSEKLTPQEETAKKKR